MPEWARERSWELLLAVILVGTIVYNATQSPVYLDVDNFVNLFRLSIEKVIVAVAIVIINGEIDLSVASVMAFAACVLAAAHESGVPFGLAIVIALAAAGVGLRWRVNATWLVFGGAIVGRLLWPWVS